MSERLDMGRQIAENAAGRAAAEEAERIAREAAARRQNAGQFAGPIACINA